MVAGAPHISSRPYDLEGSAVTSYHIKQETRQECGNGSGTTNVASFIITWYMQIVAEVGGRFKNKNISADTADR